uniref:Uncharacterized protein n=1 Tax=blood disease bacterium R229 TaxID=741978 RepID=G2ZSM2_9RALS|nr:hypothetical protein BDB_180075 [blood disease bacterium R229]
MGRTTVTLGLRFRGISFSRRAGTLAYAYEWERQQQPTPIESTTARNRANTGPQAQESPTENRRASGIGWRSAVRRSRSSRRWMPRRSSWWRLGKRNGLGTQRRIRR